MTQQTETVHASPPDGSGITPCCGRTPFELPRTDRMTQDPQDVTCQPAVAMPVGRAVSARQYPIDPTPDDDPRFTRGLALDAARVLKTHGYPEITSGGDFVELQQALFRFLYGPGRPPAAR